MYDRKDLRGAEKRLRAHTFWMLSLPLLMLMAYVAAIFAGKPIWMLVSMLLAFVWLMLTADLCWLPAVRYRNFLREMNRGQRHSLRCILDEMQKETQLQDGVRVRALQVRLPESGDCRIFYINIDKLDRLPAMGACVELTSYGRHIVNCEAVKV